MDKMLSEARKHLIYMSERLACRRKQTVINQIDRDFLKKAEDEVLEAMDRVWAIQCMSNPSVH